MISLSHWGMFDIPEMILHKIGKKTYFARFSEIMANASKPYSITVLYPL